MILRSRPEERDKIFLTFDDGPDAALTPRVLDLLKRKNAHATFYLIAEKIAALRTVVERMRSEGHAIGNHSLDHNYAMYFRGESRLRCWLKASEEVFAREGLRDLAGFRPPAGVITPPLRRAARSLGLPLVLWNERFYDAVWPWTEARARKSAARLQGGSIILLHDRQKAEREDEFLRVLELYIDLLQARGFHCASLTLAPNPLAKSLPLSAQLTSQSETVPL